MAKLARQSLAKGELQQYRKKMRESVVLTMQSARRAQLEPAQAGVWYDIAQLKQDVALFNNPLVTGDLKPPQGLALQLQGKSVVWDVITAVRNRVNAAIRPTVVMLRAVDGTCTKVKDLLQQYKDLSDKGDDDGVAALRDTLLRQAMDSCKEAETYAAQGNNSFTCINDALTNFQIELNRQINQCQYEADQAIANAEQRIEMTDNYYGVMLELEGILAYMAVFESWYRWLGVTRATMDGQALTWKGMAETVSCCLGNVYGSLDSVYTWVEMDPTRYEELIDGEWDNISHDSNEVLCILASVGIDINQTRRRVPGRGGGEPKKLELRRAVPIQPKRAGDSALVVKAMKAPDDLAKTVNNAATQARSFFDKLEETMELPYLADLVGYWDEKGEEKQPLEKVVAGLQHRYDDNMTTQHPAVSGLWSFSRSAPGYAQEISGADANYMNTILNSLSVAAERPMNAARDAADKFDAASSALAEAMRQIQTNLDSIEKQMVEVDGNIDQLEDQERDKVLSLIADVVTIIFATGALLFAIAVLGPVGAAIDGAAALGGGATLTAGAIKTAIDALDLAGIEELLSLAKSTRRDLDKTHQALETVRPLFGELTSHAGEIATSAVDLVAGLQDLQDSVAGWDSVQLSEDDLEIIVDSWKEVENASLAWMHVFEEQGLKPPAKARVKKDEAVVRSLRRLLLGRCGGRVFLIKSDGFVEEGWAQKLDQIDKGLKECSFWV